MSYRSCGSFGGLERVYVCGLDSDYLIIYAARLFVGGNKMKKKRNDEFI